MLVTGSQVLSVLLAPFVIDLNQITGQSDGYGDNVLIQD